MGKHLHIDAFAGIAGDMFLGACVDLGASLEEIDAALKPLPVKLPYRITVMQTHRHAIGATDLKVIVGNEKEDATIDNDDHSHDHNHSHDHSHGHDHTHSHSHNQAGIGHAHHHKHHTGYRQIMDMIDQLDTTDRAKDRARAIVTHIGKAEAHVHRVSLETVHFHEVGAVDSIVDMLGSAIALELLEVDTATSSALPIGFGFVQCDHGRMPLPAPATAEILKSVPHYGVDREGETVTPTGAAIVAAIANKFGRMPAMCVDNVGYGAGDRDTADVPNLLRLHLGNRISGAV